MKIEPMDVIGVKHLKPVCVNIMLEDRLLKWNKKFFYIILMFYSALIFLKWRKIIINDYK